jgi:metal-responsive CopG/Arc/MetJ family transcriptional regulator
MTGAPMRTPNLTSKTRMTFGISVTAPIQRAIEEMLIAKREFSRSKLIVDAIVEKADRDLPANWRETVGMAEDEDAA